MREAQEQARNDELFASIAATPIATVITNPRIFDNPIVAVNNAFCTLTGYSENEVIGRNCRFLNTRGCEPEPLKVIRQAVGEARPALAELTNYRKDGSAFRNAVMIAPMLNEQGRLAWFVGSQMDVSDRGLTPSMRPRPEAQARIALLTRRHKQVLEFMVAGYRNKQIAEFLRLSEKTVKMHRKDMLVRLSAPTTADAIRIGVEAGLAHRHDECGS